MFEKLLSVIPYNPGLIHQMGFYSRRMREEASIRRTGMVFIVLAFMIQFFAVISPPQVTSASEDNDLISGGISSRAEAVHACQNNIRDYEHILRHYGVSCDAVASADVVELKSTDYDRGLHSVGHNPYGKAGETPVSIDGHNIFWRYLWSWDTAGPSTYKALKLHSSDGNKTYWILYSCGNLTTIGMPSPVAPPAPAPAPAPTPAPAPAPRPATPAPAPTPAPTPAPVVPTVTPPKPCQYDTSILASDSRCKACIYNGSILASSSECKPCDKSLSSEDTTACLTVHKKASNITANVSDANGTTAQPNDVIVYTLSATNGGKGTINDFSFQESLSDVLDYADVTDLHGGTIDNFNDVIWPKEDIKSGATASHQITVKVKATVPSTPVDPINPEHFNLVMTNVYGDTVNIKVPAPTVKAVQVAAANLPNTGPGSTMLIATTIVLISGYFYGRARLLARESVIAIQENTGA